MRYFIFILLSLTFISTTQAQQYSRIQLDAMYNEFIKIKTEQNANAPVHADSEHVKCAFGVVNSVIVNMLLFTPQQQSVLKTMLDRPLTDTSIVTSSGFFKIHYDVTGFQMLKYSINDLMTAVDSAFYFETNFLGYPAPPQDADGYYHIYATNLGGGLYGYTQFEGEITPGSGRYHSYMLIDNDYTGYYSAGINGARVTVAHEMHHAIQVGNYLYREEDLYYYEMTSTAMEEFVFDSVNDYYAYMKDNKNYLIFSNRAFASNSGYDIAIWNIFLADKFGFDILKKQWDLMKNMRALNAIANSLFEYNSTFGEEYRDFGISCFYTGYRATLPEASNNYTFEEAAKYPIIKPITTLPLPSPDVKMNSLPTANNYLRFVNGLDTLYTIVSNCDYKSGIDSLNSLFPFQYHLFEGEREGTYKLTDRYFASFSAQKPAFWSASEIYNNTLVSEGNILAESIDYTFPSPFYYNKNSFIFIPIIPGNSSEVDLNIYTSSMNLVYVSRQNISTLYGRFVVKWNGKNNNGEKLATGVYIYVAKTADDIKKGKLVIFNE